MTGTAPMVITGAQGFLGHNLLKQLTAMQTPVRILAGDIADGAVRRQFLIPPTASVFFHFAGISSVGLCDQDPGLCQRINTEAPAALAEQFWQACPQGLFVFPSTAQVYAESTKVLTEASPLGPISRYAQTKLDAEDQLLALQKKYQGGLFILRLFNHTHKSQPPHFFLPSIYQQLLKSPHLAVGDVELERDIGAVQDLLAAFVKIIAVAPQLRGATVANLSTGRPKRLKDLIEELAKTLGVALRMKVDPARLRAGEPRSIVGDSRRLQERIGWRPVHGESVKSVIEAFLAELP